MGKTKYDWNKIQKFYDDDHTWEDIEREFGVCMDSISKACRRGQFKSRDRSHAGILRAKIKPQVHSEETKNKISKARKKYLKEHPEKVPYLLNHYTKGPSIPEQYFDKIFTESDLKLTKQHQFGPFRIDFCDLKKKIAIEINGDQHYLDKRIIESDKRKNISLEENGWIFIPIKWSEFQKLSDLEKKTFTDKLINFLNSKEELLNITEEEIDGRIRHRHICEYCERRFSNFDKDTCFCSQKCYRNNRYKK